ncbi:MAG: DASS family sodium-coupled anion symporter [Bacteroidia bacterium]
MLPIILFPLTGAADIASTTSAYGDSVIFLFMGGFLLALAMERWNLHRRIAINIISRTGTRSKMLILGFMVATAFLSMWISNTATAMMMLPIGLAIILQESRSLEIQNGGAARKSVLAKPLMLAIAYAASIGGLATLIGTPPNIVMAAIVEDTLGNTVFFSDWLLFALPLSLILLGVCWVYLVWFFNVGDHQLVQGNEDLKRQLHELGKITVEEKRVLIIFCLTAFCWISRSFWLTKIIPQLNDTMISLAGATLLFIIPAKGGERLMNWDTAKKLPWGILLLFGGGLAIAEGFTTSGLAEWIGSHLSEAGRLNLIILMLLVVALINFLTEITSNTATATIFLPVLASLSLGLGVSPYRLMISATLAASCAFMLPVATPPNAVVFGSGQLEMRDMVKAGFSMNIISVIIITAYCYFLIPFFFN